MAQDLEALGSSTGYEVGHEEARDRDPGLQSKGPPSLADSDLNTSETDGRSRRARARRPPLRISCRVQVHRQSFDVCILYTEIH